MFTTKGCEKYDAINSRAKAFEIKNLMDNNKVPYAENMYTNEMIQKTASLYLQDIYLYCSEIQNGYIELDYWIRRAI